LVLTTHQTFEIVG